MIHVEQLHFSVGTFSLADVSLHVRPGEYFVLLGPSGSGKTLLLECLCGLNQINSGQIRIDGVDVTRLEPRRRGIGYLPQDYALFPHKTVRENIRFGLEHRGMEAASVRRRVDELMERVGVTDLADRLPQKLSGGEKQRVALARALAIEPQVLLLDEPVSALDEPTRDSLCRQLKQLQRSTQTTTVHVCHNFVEMLAVADRVAMVRNGRVLQVGAPQEILQRPGSLEVARFVQAGNLFEAQARPDGQWLQLTCSGDVKLLARPPASNTCNGNVVALIRPENISLGTSVPEHVPPGTTMLEASVSSVVDLGPLVRLAVGCGGSTELVLSLSKREYNGVNVQVGDHVYLAIAADDVHVLEA